MRAHQTPSQRHEKYNILHRGHALSNIKRWRENILRGCWWQWDTSDFSHGFGSGSKLWRFQVPALKEAGYRPIIWDMRAHAKSEGPDDLTKYSKMTQVNDLKAV